MVTHRRTAQNHAQASVREDVIYLYIASYNITLETIGPNWTLIILEVIVTALFIFFIVRSKSRLVRIELLFLLLTVITGGYLLLFANGEKEVTDGLIITSGILCSTGFLAIAAIEIFRASHKK